MKKILSVITVVAIAFILSGQPVFAVSDETNNNENVTIEYLDDGSYFVTEIEINEPLQDISSYSTLKTRVGTKTSTMKNASGSVMWQVKVEGTYQYGSGSAKCTKAVVSASSYSSAWKIASKSSSKSVNKAIGKATAKRYVAGSVVQTVPKTVTLTCSSTGKLS